MPGSKTSTNFKGEAVSIVHQGPISGGAMVEMNPISTCSQESHVLPGGEANRGIKTEAAPTRGGQADLWWLEDLSLIHISEPTRPY